MMKPNELLDEAKTLQPQLQKWRRTIHRNPEVGFDLPKTGDHGTWMYSLVGILLMSAAAGVIVLTVKKKNGR